MIQTYFRYAFLALSFFSFQTTISSSKALIAVTDDQDFPKAIMESTEQLHKDIITCSKYGSYHPAWNHMISSIDDGHKERRPDIYNIRFSYEIEKGQPKEQVSAIELAEKLGLQDVRDMMVLQNAISNHMTWGQILCLSLEKKKELAEQIHEQICNERTETTHE